MIEFIPKNANKKSSVFADDAEDQFFFSMNDKLSSSITKECLQFIPKNANKKSLTFADVAEDQFFLCCSGYLYQKVNPVSANCISDPEGKPFAEQSVFSPEDKILKILPEIEKISF